EVHAAYQHNSRLVFHDPSGGDGRAAGRQIGKDHTRAGPRELFAYRTFDVLRSHAHHREHDELVSHAADLTDRRHESAGELPVTDDDGARFSRGVSHLFIHG